MKPGHGSRTAVLVCMGRAIADGTTTESRFSDPTALALLPDDMRDRVEIFRVGGAPKGIRGRLNHTHLEKLSKVMVARTVAIDDAVREAASPQLVILGAGLDGRAWRMPELGETTVFEVDHPDTQREKRGRVAALAQTARDVRFTPVDFTRDSLDDALSAAGHDLASATTWLWEGVVMYLAPADIEATLAVIKRRSAAGSRLIVMYHSPAHMLRLIGLIVRWMGEPLRSSFTPDAMRALVARYGFGVVWDADMSTIGGAMSAEIAEGTRRMKHSRIVVANRFL
ncbi:MAG: SAM-dependent methyltransferase [Chloracidobacterium sp.]|nr:SAM-dependent methyltransferase [Chloracidobacterium sp.]